MALVKIGSVTRASRAVDVLGSAGIDAHVRKLGNMNDGCVHAVEVKEQLLGKALEILKSNGIAAKQFK